MSYEVCHLIAIHRNARTIVAAQETNRPQQSNAGSGVIVYAEGGAFLIQGPKGWIADHDTGSGMGVCCVFYPEGSAWGDAETVIYPNIATKRSRQANLEQFMELDLSDFRDHNPGMTYENAEDVPMKNKRVAKLRFFHGVNNGSSEAIAYVDEDKIIALVVVSSKTQKGLNEAMPLLRDILQSYSFMDVRFAPGVQPRKN